MMEIRKIEKAELPQIAILETKIFPDSWSEKALEETLEQSNAFILGALEREKLIAYLIVYHVLDEGEIVRIAVEESRRRTGVAGHLLLALENICEDKGIVNLFLEVREHNETAVAFYKDKGFVETGIRKNFYTNPIEDGILMCRGLGR